MRRRHRRSPEDRQRRAGSREPRRRILVICEARVTEPKYLAELKVAFRNRLVELEIALERGAPKILVERAASRKRQAESDAKRRLDNLLRYDEVWCVFDVDEHPPARIQEARLQASADGIHLAISNPCFELWALLHFQDHTAHIERRDARNRLRRHLPGYEKALPFARLHPTYAEAVRRAQELERRREDADDPGGNPSTGVYRLTERIREGRAGAFEEGRFST